MTCESAWRTPNTWFFWATAFPRMMSSTAPCCPRVGREPSRRCIAPLWLARQGRMAGSRMARSASTAKEHKHEPASGAQKIQAAIDIFGDKHVRAYTAGIPQVFGMPPSRERILGLLYPVGVGIECFTPDGVRRDASG